jgi:ribonuclease D
VTESGPPTSTADAVDVIRLDQPADGIPDVVAAPHELSAAVDLLAAGRGPVAVDAERASGYRYGQRAYLLQLRRSGAGTVLIDPTTVGDLTALQAVLAEPEWVLHAASQDLPCLAEIGLRPRHLFDTELAGRLLGLPRVGLAALTESLLGVQLAKEHSAVDWSTRPLPEPWLAYAALDVELLLPLRDRLAAMLDDAGKREWAAQEFDRVAAAPPPTPRTDPWRRTSGLHRVRGRRPLAVVRELWLERDEIARRRDTAPGRLLPDAAIVAVATAMPRTGAELHAVNGFHGRGAASHRARWEAAVDRALTMPDDELPDTAPAGDGPPPPRAWAARSPEAAARLQAARAAVTEVAGSHGLPPENLVSPDLIRRICWEPPADTAEPGVRAALFAGGAREWQVDLVAPPLCVALAALVTDE